LSPFLIDLQAGKPFRNLNANLVVDIAISIKKILTVLNFVTVCF
jgi:hypothetical protein